ncbi:putative PH domain containing protein [Lyophyllum shimeji]|uniref:PH domain containing protein n=1 Tax=Lyophyllum shimeji TaxID=47721 RepID=A0A9P3PS56_LYOSH|nr:putative PH domain containing protein [Lyophyllum shimeji]
MIRPLLTVQDISRGEEVISRLRTGTPPISRPSTSSEEWFTPSWLSPAAAVAMPTAAPPSPQEIHRKLSVRSVAGSAKPPPVSTSVDGPVSGTESDSDSILSPNITSSGQGLGGSLHAGSSMQPPLSSIAERQSGSGEDSDEEEEEEGGWKSADIRGHARDSIDESVIKSGYLWKKGERRKTWKKRWFVLRPAHLAYYKNSAEYQLLRLLELSDVHSCTQVTLKRHENTFGLVSPVRTFYLQASSPGELQEWVRAIEEARQNLTATSTQNSVSSPIPIPTPTRRSASHLPPPTTPSPPAHGARAYNVTSSDSEDASPSLQNILSTSSQDRQIAPPSPTKVLGSVPKDSSKIVLSGYLMKCGSKRRNWRKRWFVLTGEKLIYSGSHMDTKPHRQFSFSQILDALEYDLPSNRHNPPSLSTPITGLPSSISPASEADDIHGTHTFKIITTKRSLLLCAPTEEDEIKWLGAVRALIARRSGAGTVPGEPTSQAMVSSRSADSQAPVAHASGNGIKAKVRRLSASASGGGTVTEESAHDRP